MKDAMPIGCAVVGVVALFVGAAGIGIAKANHVEHKTCEIVGKESVAKGDNGHEYRVYTENCGTLSVADNIWKMRFDSADTYGMLTEGETYDLETIGWRVPFLSWTPNIIEATPAR